MLMRSEFREIIETVLQDFLEETDHADVVDHITAEMLEAFERRFPIEDDEAE